MPRATLVALPQGASVGCNDILVDFERNNYWSFHRKTANRERLELASFWNPLDGAGFDKSPNSLVFGSMRENLLDNVAEGQTLVVLDTLDKGCYTFKQPI